MTITIEADLADELQERARAEGLTVQAYVERLMRDESDWKELSEEPLARTDPEFAEIWSAVKEGLGQAERGEARPMDEVLARLRAKHGISD